MWALVKTQHALTVVCFLFRYLFLYFCLNSFIQNQMVFVIQLMVKKHAFVAINIMENFVNGTTIQIIQMEKEY